jgi:hypothetical protein
MGANDVAIATAIVAIVVRVDGDDGKESVPLVLSSTACALTAKASQCSYHISKPPQQSWIWVVP